MIIQMDSATIILIVHPTLLQSLQPHRLFQKPIFSYCMEIKTFNLGIETAKEKLYIKDLNGI